MKSQTFQTFQTFADSPPPLRLRFKDYRSAQAEVSRLEALLGIAPGNKNFNIVRLNEHIRGLEDLVAKNVSNTPPTAKATPAPAPIAIETLRGLEFAVFGANSTFVGTGDESAQRTKFAKVIYERNLTVPGLDTSAFAGTWRNEVFGSVRTARAAEQRKIDAFFAKKSNTTPTATASNLTGHARFIAAGIEQKS